MYVLWAADAAEEDEVAAYEITIEGGRARIELQEGPDALPIARQLAQALAQALPGLVTIRRAGAARPVAQYRGEAVSRIEVREVSPVPSGRYEE